MASQAWGDWRSRDVLHNNDSYLGRKLSDLFSFVPRHVDSFLVPRSFVPRVDA